MEGGSYDVIRKRLLEAGRRAGGQGRDAQHAAQEGLRRRELALIANERIRTEHNCIARDLVSVAGHMLFGFQVFMGLKTETGVSDVFASTSSRRRTATSGTSRRCPSRGPARSSPTKGFVKELRDTFKYYSKDARLLRLKRTDTALGSPPCRVGATVRDAKVFRWAIDSAGRLTYMDARATRRSSLRSSTTSRGRPRAVRTRWRARTRTSTSSTPSSSRRFTATSRSRSRTTPRTARASTASPSTTRTRRSTTRTCRGRRSGP